MGIVAFCPSGHRVKVKDHLAGKKGICPHCGATFRIPVTGPTAAPPSATTPGLPRAAVVSLDTQLAASLPPVIALAEQEPRQPGADHEPPAGAGPGELPAERVPVPRAIAEAPGSTWCWALPGGQASPQLHADGMREWLDSGMVTGAELVWRSDWTNWMPLREVFPEACPSPSRPDFRRP